MRFLVENFGRFETLMKALNPGFRSVAPQTPILAEVIPTCHLLELFRTGATRRPSAPEGQKHLPLS